ncbi:AAC(3) family N-acetyltransferase [Christiangramia sp. ASW11-125]|uniref:AAC(3) family N-acetyltransferase n=1 Tax=Christiangramia sp. ASW11-125 TaxID=3400701 RepID=UPI003AAFD58D
MIEAELENFIKQIDLPKNQILFLHVRLKGIANDLSYDILSKKIISLFEDLYSPKTILVPTFTYAYTKTGVYNKMESPAEVGRFSEEIRKMYDWECRTNNPVFNVIDTKKYFTKYNLKEETAFGDDSLMHLLHEMGHIVINLNVENFISTYLHFLEYHYNVPYRYIKSFPGEVILSTENTKQVNYKYHVRDLDADTSWDRNMIKETLADANGLRVYNSGGIELSWIDSEKMESILGKKLTRDKNFLLG